MDKTLKQIVCAFLMGMGIASTASALNFDEEINRQERMVKVRYMRPPHSLAYFLKQYETCNSHNGHARTKCNISEAKRRYLDYQVAWNDRQKERQRLADANVENGPMKVSLQPRVQVGMNP